MEYVVLVPCGRAESGMIVRSRSTMGINIFNKNPEFIFPYLGVKLLNVTYNAINAEATTTYEAEFSV